MTIDEMIRFEEGSKLSLYRCSENFWTIGIGYLVTRENCTRERAIKILDSKMGRSTGGSITHQEESMLFGVSMAEVTQGIKQGSFGGVYERLDKNRQMALVNMTYQLGVGGVSKFKKFIAALDRKDWVEASKQGFDSLWARQTPNRARRVMAIIKTGTLDSYK
ncbi:sulfurtransferase [Aeromonas hydrophila]|uniref:glycoside hydrolase family protein n=1 Tax=Aeromonas hydrophila TaxID=644 RepID=UPI00107EA35F|nr:glycoside hydrolase family protein [Aeromonas hydrophila]QBX71559.1 sulfurtransferase [Aeromonas hydrophila]QBX76259.1 sulfurtransferase [Aeromonas hydrophila]